VTGKAIFKKGLFAALIKVCSQVLVVVSGIVVARYLGPTNYGIYSYTMAMVGVFILISQLGFTTYSVKQISVYESLQEWVNLRSYMLFAFLVVLLGSVAITFLCFYYFHSFSSNPNKQYLIIGLILIPLSAVFRVLQSFMNGFEFINQAELIILSRQLTFIAICALALVTGYIVFDPALVLYSQAIATSAGILLYLGFLYKRKQKAVFSERNYNYSKAWLVGAVSFIMLSMMHYINTQTDTLMLGFFRESDEVGYYRVASQASMLMAFLAQIALLLIGPIIARLYVKNEFKELQRLVLNSTRIMFVFSLAVFFVLFLFSKDLINLLFGAAFLEAELPLIILSVGKLLASLFSCAAILLNMCGYEKRTTKILFLSAVLNVLLNFVLVPAYGTMGASISTSVVVVISAYMLYRVVASI